ncbi:tRNA (adenosine(37)-N6)-dimethylallyltransferase MiaA [Candidatus Roizmanbacteria bacterium CG10_big_fil_rev_8_21_14_0_10_45_7]|uniref:tRNA dimethylallyltransferase n=1 Tax=Candidatus Roizmanbacteria bacterium CG10_big_fil_rev_8_21_14_0_10_45_7 TaxID=1974854 RepID=A0A2M8KU35_9BACT|nr:MAG: tRNA (adenosine(37)-N6)-dimethylallyltransferase MiaA [Candidatus Roizmanbacteria bacterium CG10_big_fil_rev_8_21_14_0_10_45_7]
MKNSNTIVVITGQTATGKTKLGLSLAKEINGDIISADSRQAYRYLDVISGKDIEDSNFVEVKKQGIYSIGYYTIQGVRVWLYDMCTPKDYLSAYDWAVAARSIITQLHQEKRTPIIVGGAFHYIRTLLYGLTAIAEPDKELRTSLMHESASQLQQRLKELDETALNALNQSDRWNPRRLIRRIEAAAATGGGASFPGLIDTGIHTFTCIGLLYSDTDELEQHINERVQARLDGGALEEVDLLIHMGYRPEHYGMLKTIGYQQLMAYSKGTLTLEAAISQWKVKEYQYAKRQKTFITHDPSFILTSPDTATLDWVMNVV